MFGLPLSVGELRGTGVGQGERRDGAGPTHSGDTSAS